MAPENLHLSSAISIQVFPKPLTISPGSAHPCPRTPSLRYPAEAHHPSRKASPDRTLRLVQ